MPLGPFNNIYGMGASPVIVGDTVVLACDQSLGSYLMAVDKRTGRVRWKVDRPEAKSGHSTPILWRGPDGKDQIVLPGSFLLTSYDAATGKKLWWVGGLSFEMKSTPVIGGDTIYVNGYGAPVNDPGNKVTVPAADEVWKTADADGNGLISKPEFPKFTGAFWFDVADLDQSGALTKDEWAYYRAALDSENGMLAIRLGGSGDMSDKAIRWKYQRSVPQLPSPLLYGGVLYMVNDNGIITTLNPETGALDQAGAADAARPDRITPRRSPPMAHLLHQRGGRRRRRRTGRRSRDEGRQRSGRRHLRDPGVCRRPHLRAHDGRALRVRSAGRGVRSGISEQYRPPAIDRWRSRPIQSLISGPDPERRANGAKDMTRQGFICVCLVGLAAVVGAQKPPAAPRFQVDPDVAEGDAQQLDPRRRHRRVRRRQGSHLGDASPGDADRGGNVGGAEAAHRHLLRAGADGDRVRCGGQRGAGLGRADAGHLGVSEATRTASSSTTTTSSGSAPTCTTACRSSRATASS